MTTEPALPAPSKQHSAEARFQMGDRFLIHARQELEKGHRLQAGNKAYNAVVQYLKVIAESRGWRHRSDDDLRAVSSVITSELRDGRLSTDLGNIYFRGHRNYYENDTDPQEVSAVVVAAEESIPKLRIAAESPPGEVTIASANERNDYRRITGDRNLEVGDTSKVGFSKRHDPPNDDGPEDGDGNIPSRPSPERSPYGGGNAIEASDPEGLPEAERSSGSDDGGASVSRPFKNELVVRVERAPKPMGTAIWRVAKEPKAKEPKFQIAKPKIPRPQSASRRAKPRKQTRHPWLSRAETRQLRRG